jgi:predicted kinase
VYAAVAERAKMTVRQGHSAIVDAVYARPADRQAIERVAADASVPFVGIWLEASEPTLVARIERRRDDASDANADIIRSQKQQGAGVVTWRAVEASSSATTVLEHTANYVQSQVPGVLNTRRGRP